MSFSKALRKESRPFTPASYFTTHMQNHMQVAQICMETMRPSFEAWVTLAADALQRGRKILFFGNGGSAADAQHLATEFTVRFIKNRSAMAALALTTDTSTLTAIGNDLGFEFLFSRQLEALAHPGDIAIGITTSGRSPNVVKAFEQANAMDLKTVALTGAGPHDLASHVDLCIAVPSQITSHIQEMHITLGQMLCGALEHTLGLVADE